MQTKWIYGLVLVVVVLGSTYFYFNPAFFSSDLAIQHVTGTSLSCPVDAGMALIRVSLYDGLPSEKADLLPEKGGWKDLGKAISPEGYYLQCGYGNDTQGTSQKLVTFELPKAFTQCLLTGEGLQVLCK